MGQGLQEMGCWCYTMFFGILISVALVHYSPVYGVLFLVLCRLLYVTYDEYYNPIKQCD